MVYLLPPQVARRIPGSSSYAHAYSNILAVHRRSPSISSTSVTILIAPDVDALCAARMLADLLKQDDIIYSIVPISGIDHLESIKGNLINSAKLHTLILLNMGSILDLPSSEWFGDFEQTHLSVHVIDSTRPQNLSSLFGETEAARKIIVWDDGGADTLSEEQQAWQALMHDPESDTDSDEDSDLESDPHSDQSSEDEEDENGYQGPESRKRKSPRDSERKAGKRRKTTHLSRDERERYSHKIQKYYSAGTWYGQSASSTMYLLATSLERVDNELLWLAIMGLTYQYITSRISRMTYDKYYSIYLDEVARLNPSDEISSSRDTASIPLSDPDDTRIRATDELRFMLFRHWNLYDAMFHSSYIASRLGIWKEKGRKQLIGLLAKMGFSLIETQQPYHHMDLKLKSSLMRQLNVIAPEYGLVELSYPSFVRSFGYKSQPMSAADAVEAISALLDVASGVKLQIEIEGGRNGGEWFGSGRIWEKHVAMGGSSVGRGEIPLSRDERENIPPGLAKHAQKWQGLNVDVAEETGVEAEDQDPWWQNNFWTAFDALSNSSHLHPALSLSMSLHRSIIRQGTSIIDKHSIKTMRSHRVVILTQGPDLALFSHPGVLSRLALWLVDTLRDRAPDAFTSGRGKKKSLPMVVACLNEASGTYLVVGVMAAVEFGDIRKNEFGLAFLDAKERCNARTRHGSFDTSVLEINQADLKMFLEALCEISDGY